MFRAPPQPFAPSGEQFEENGLNGDEYDDEQEYQVCPVASRDGSPVAPV